MDADERLGRPNRPDADEQRHGPAADPSAESLERFEVEQDLRHGEPGAGGDLAVEALGLEAEIVGGRVDGCAGEERRRRVDRAAVPVLARVELGEQLDETDRVDVVDPVRARVVTGLRRVAGDREDVPDPFRMCAEQERLEPGDRRVPRRQVRDRLDPGEALDRDGGHDPAHPRPRARVVVDVDELPAARVAHGARRLDQRLRVGAERRIDLHRDRELALSEHPRELGLSRGRLERHHLLSLPDEEGARWAAVRVDRLADRGDLGRRRAAAPAYQPRPERARLRRELGEVGGGGVRKDDALAAHARREADVRQRCEHGSVAAHLRQRCERGRGTGARGWRRRRRARAVAGAPPHPPP